LKELRINLKAEILLFESLGHGKTLIAKAVVNEACANFIHIKVPLIYHFYVFPCLLKSLFLILDFTLLCVRFCAF
jgi:ATP-dependent 26S proteasome regulatory subunit